MLEIDKVTTHHGYTAAFQEISLRVAENEIVTLLGSNGAGKTSLLMTVCGVYRPTSGTITFEGRQIQGLPPHRIVAMGISQSPEDRKLFGKMSVGKNLKLGAYVRRSDRSSVARSLEKVLELFPILKERSNQSAGTLSGGEQKMLSIGRAMMADPRLLMLDEPSLGLAPKIIESIMNTVALINEKTGTTILMVEQNASAALKIAHRGYVIEAGKVVLEGKKKDLIQNDQVKQAYLGG